MKPLKFLRFVLLKEKDYLEIVQPLKELQKQLREKEAIIKDTNIQKEKKILQKKYSGFFGRWFEGEDGVFFQIRGIYYHSSSWSYNKWYFNCYAPNLEDADDILISNIVDEDDAGNLTISDSYKEVNPKECLK